MTHCCACNTYSSPPTPPPVCCKGNVLLSSTFCFGQVSTKTQSPNVMTSTEDASGSKIDLDPPPISERKVWNAIKGKAWNAIKRPEVSLDHLTVVAFFLFTSLIFVKVIDMKTSINIYIHTSSHKYVICKDLHLPVKHVFIHHMAFLNASLLHNF